MESNHITAIDPGIGGAVCFMDGDTVQVFDTPVESGQYDLAGMAAILRGRKGTVLLEAVHALPKQGVSSTFNFGRGVGLWEGICAAECLRLVKVAPQKWKSKYPELRGLDRKSAKSKAREIARRLFPGHADKFARVKDDGRAEALLMAQYLKDLVSNAEAA